MIPNQSDLLIRVTLIILLKSIHLYEIDASILFIKINKWFLSFFIITTLIFYVIIIKTFQQN